MNILVSNTPVSLTFLYIRTSRGVPGLEQGVHRPAVLSEAVGQGSWTPLLSVPSAGGLQTGESSCHVVARSPHSCTASSGQAVHGEVAHATMLWTLRGRTQTLCVMGG